MKLVYFTHSLLSCWNHGNAHFLRGVLRELVLAGHEVAVYEPRDAWSLANLLQDHGPEALEPFETAYPELASRRYGRDLDLDEALAGADAVLVHEWNDPWLIEAVGRLRRRGARFRLLFHDTHHRAVSDPDAIGRLDLDGYDGVLAFGESLAAVYRRRGWGARAFVWHEAADIRLFKPPAREVLRQGLVWIGNWGDGEREAEIESYLLRPALGAGLPLTVHGVRYPPRALDLLARHGARYAGWLANPLVPDSFARHIATVHVPRRYYAERLPGIPTIRVFESLACGIPLVCAPWSDSESLFEPGEDFLPARSEREMTEHLRALAHDRDLAEALAARGLAAVRARHSCAHRAAELSSILRMLAAPAPMEAAI